MARICSGVSLTSTFWASLPTNANIVRSPSRHIPPTSDEMIRSSGVWRQAVLRGISSRTNDQLRMVTGPVNIAFIGFVVNISPPLDRHRLRARDASMDVGNDGPQEGEEFLRDQGHRIPERRRAWVGVKVIWEPPRALAGTTPRRRPPPEVVNQILSSDVGHRRQPARKAYFSCGIDPSRLASRRCGWNPEEEIAACRIWLNRLCNE
jgi:hypothetical protein